MVSINVMENERLASFIKVLKTQDGIISEYDISL